MASQTPVLPLFVAFLALTGLVSACGNGDEPDEFEIIIAGQVLDYPLSLPERPGVSTVAQAVSPLTVKVGDVECLVVDLTDPSTRNTAGELVIRVGAPGQPRGCAEEGARIVLIDRNGAELYEEYVFRAGTSVVLPQLGPKPPD